MAGIQQFGGDWTTEKLERLRKYLSAYTTILSNQPFTFAYIDAFAGTGYRELKEAGNPANLLLPELTEPESERFLEGSAGIALSCIPPFIDIFLSKKALENLPNCKPNWNRSFQKRQKASSSVAAMQTR